MARLKSPHYSSTIKFLRYLRDNRFISRGGREYSEPEVLAMLIEKETRKGYRNPKQDAPHIDSKTEIRNFQEDLFSLVKTWRLRR